MNQIVSQCIVLSRTNFGEADRILTVLTPKNGRLRLMAKGVRKVKSKLAGGIELFCVSDITFIKGKGDIDTLISTRLKHYYPNINKDLNRTMFGYEILKLINKIIEDNSGEEYFLLLWRFFEGLDDLELNQEALQLWLYSLLLKLMGHSPNLSADLLGNEFNNDQTYDFNMDKMAFSTSKNGIYHSNNIKLISLAIRLNSPLKLKQVQDLEASLPASLDLTASMLTQFTGYQ